MPVPAQTPHLVNNVWIVFIKDSAFSMVYDVYLRNFDVNDRQRKEYSVLWFRQMWKKLNDLAGTTHPLTLSIEDIENSYNPSRPLYGKLQFEAKIIYSRNDGKYYHILVVDSFNYTLPYTDYYGGKRVIIENKQYNTMKNTRNKVRLTESQLHNVIKESVRKMLNELGHVHISDGYDQDGFDKNGYDKDGYDREGWNRDGMHLDGYSRAEYDAMTQEHDQLAQRLREPSINLLKQINSYITLIRDFKNEEEGTIFRYLFESVAETSDVLSDCISYLSK